MSENPNEMSLEDTQAALKEARRQAAEYRTKYSNVNGQLKTARDALEALGLDPDADDVVAQAQALSKQAGAGKQVKELEAKLEGYKALLDDYTEVTGIDLAAMYTELGPDATEEQIAAAYADALAPLDALADRAAYADLRDAADALNLPVQTLQEYLGDKSLMARTEGEGDEARVVWGVGDADKFSPLAEQSAVQLLQKASTQPERAPQAGLRQTAVAKETEPKTVEERKGELRTQISI